MSILKKKNCFGLLKQSFENRPQSDVLCCLHYVQLTITTTLYFLIQYIVLMLGLLSINYGQKWYLNSFMLYNAHGGGRQFLKLTW